MPSGPCPPSWICQRNKYLFIGYVFKALLQQGIRTGDAMKNKRDIYQPVKNKWGRKAMSGGFTSIPMSCLKKPMSMALSHWCHTEL